MIRLHQYVMVLLLVLGYVGLAYAMPPEICDNGIDDDHDGLVDILDPDCACSGLDVLAPTSLFPNPSFEEELAGCEGTGVGRAHCALGWISPSRGNPDYIDECGSDWNGLYPEAPCPIPQGERFFGIADQMLAGRTFKEYVGTFLTSPLEQDSTYVLSFWIGYVNSGDRGYHSSPTDFHVYGNTSNTAMPFEGSDCPTNSFIDTFGAPINPWDDIAFVNLSVGDYEWRQYSVEFTPGANYSSILLGPNCTQPSSSIDNYYYLDNIVLSKKSEFSNDFITRLSGHKCTDDLRLEVPRLDMTITSYQWYKDGVAVIGAASPEILVEPLPAGVGSYQCRIENNRGCVISSVYEVEELDDMEIAGPTGFCEGENIRLSVPRIYDSYSWGNGLGQTEMIEVTTPDVYAITTTDVDGCSYTDSFDLNYFSDVVFQVVYSNETGIGTNDGAIAIDFPVDVTNGLVTWQSGGIDNPRTGIGEGTYCATISASERCPVDTCLELLRDIQPISVEANIIHNQCHGMADGRIDIRVSGGVAPLNWTWDHTAGNNISVLTELEPGDYRVTVIDARDISITRVLSVNEVEPIEVELSVTEPLCHDAMTGAIEVLQVTGGRGSFEFYWDGEPGSSELLNIGSSEYELQIQDAADCVFDTIIEVPDVPALEAQVQVRPASCKGQDNGEIIIQEVHHGTSPYQYFIDGEEFTNPLGALAGDQEYVLEVIDANGCIYGHVYNVPAGPDFEVDLGANDLIVEERTNIRLNATSNLPISYYVWSSSNEILDECTDCPVWEQLITQGQMIVLEAINEYGCLAYDSVSIKTIPSKKPIHT